LQKNKDYRAVISNFERVGGMDHNIMAAILDTDDPAHVFMTLGRNMDQYQEVLDLPDGRRRARLIKMGLEPASAPPPKEPAKKVSSAPAPLGTMPSGTAESDSDVLTPDRDDRAPIPNPGEFPVDKYRGDQYDQAWYSKRAEQKRNSVGRPWSFGGKAGPGVRGR
jgi:hypothetical protein